MSEPVHKPLSVWATGQHDARTQRRDRYLPDTLAHPARMLPEIAAAAITSLTRPGEVVLDPMCGAGTTLVEALHLGRPSIGVDIEPRWADLARDNISHNHQHGTHGLARVFLGDARRLPAVLGAERFAALRGRVKLVLTSPPYGPHTHGRVSTTRGGVAKTDFRYGPGARRANLAHQPLPRLLDGLSAILAATTALLAPDGHVVITARPWRVQGELVDLPGAITTLAAAAGLRPVQRCAALLAGVRDGELVTRASFFQRTAVGKARAAGLAWQLITHEDLLIFGVARGVGRPFTRRHPRPTTNPTEPVTDATATPTRPGEQLA